ncbi:MAG TPA: hypothetical protein VK760_01410 [Candidatus Acidoferrales bacterium]|jgi:hypothetical protein|nr:hypothetical protein [Candidatus Acidoferrales bacterium]
MSVPVTIAEVRAGLQGMHQPQLTKCAGSYFGVGDNVPLASHDEIVATESLQVGGVPAGAVFLGKSGQLYVIAYKTMPDADQRQLGAVVDKRADGTPFDLSPLVPLTEATLPADLTLSPCPAN